MLGTGMMPHQNDRGNKTGQGNIGKQGILMNGPNPAAESGSSTVLPESELRTGAETSLELAGQNLKDIAQQVIQILKGEFGSFSGQESTKLDSDTKEAIQEINLKPDKDLVRKVQLIIMFFNQEAAQLLTRALKRIQEVLNSPDTSDNNSNNNFPGFGSTPTSSGSALTA